MISALTGDGCRELCQAVMGELERRNRRRRPAPAEES
jgi:hypothetical protein